MPANLCEMLVLDIAFLAGGLVLLVKGADWLVDGASDLARRFGISELAIGLTIVAFGTSTPELAVNITSSLTGANDIAIGNIVGSNTANILLILGIAGIIAPMTIQTSTVWKEIPLAFLASVVLLTMANDAVVDRYPVSELSRSDGITFIAFFLIYLWYTFGMQRIEDAEEHEQARHPLLAPFLILIGLACLVIGGKLAVDGATQIALALGISQALIGLTVVAVGTSLPELATSTVAAYRGKSDIAVGNIVGSNIFNIFFILGISGLIRPLVFRPELNVDLLVTVAATILLFVLVHTGPVYHRVLLFWRQRRGHTIQRLDSIAMLLGYFAYVGYLAWRG